MATVDVATYLSPYKQIPATVPGWDDGRQATWPASTATLLSCEGSAVLVDALMTVAEGEQLADWIGATGLELTTVYVTHAHADHFFGATSLLRRIPAARLGRRPGIARAAGGEQARGARRRGWSAARRSPGRRRSRRPRATCGCGAGSSPGRSPSSPWFRHRWTVT